MNGNKPEVNGKTGNEKSQTGSNSLKNEPTDADVKQEKAVRLVVPFLQFDSN